MNTDQLVKRLERLELDEGHADWADVLRRASSNAQQQATAVSKRRSRLVRPRVLALVCAAIVIAIVAALAPGWLGKNQQDDLLQEALAAIGTGPVVHVVLEYPQATGEVVGATGHRPILDVIDLSSGRARPAMHRLEVWWDKTAGINRAINSVDGTVLSDEIATARGYRLLEPDGSVRSSSWPTRLGHPLTPPAPFATFFTGYRHALATHQATDAGRGRIGGHDVEWLLFQVPSLQGRHLAPSSEEVAVDRQTFKPVAIRNLCPRCTVVPRIETIATLENTTRSKVNFTLSAGHPQPDVAQYGADYRTGTIHGADGFLRRRTLWPGTKVGTASLHRIEFANSFQYSSTLLHPPATDVIARGRGITLYYGNQYDYVTIAETADTGFAFHGFNMETLSPAGQPMTNAQTALPPDGEMILSDDHSEWTGQLRKDGLQIEIEASTQQQILQAARALQATP